LGYAKNATKKHKITSWKYVDKRVKWLVSRLSWEILELETWRKLKISFGPKSIKSSLWSLQSGDDRKSISFEKGTKYLLDNLLMSLLLQSFWFLCWWYSCFALSKWWSFPNP
jgi:hypothetical protein